MTNPIEIKETELRLIRTLMEGDTFCRDLLLTVPYESLDHFGSAWKIILDYHMKGIDCPSFSEIHLSPLLPEKIRYDLKAAAFAEEDYPAFTAIEDLKLYVEPMMNRYQRQVFISEGLESFQKIQEMDPAETFLPQAQNFLQKSTSLLAKWAKPRTRYGFGVGFKVHELLLAIQAEKARIIPSGMHAFDTRSGGGYATGESVFLAAPSSQGKSLVAAQEGLNMALAGFKVKIVTLEMKASANVHRFLANAGQIHVTRFRNKEMWSPEDTAAQERAGQLLQGKIHEAGGYLEIIQPEGGYTLADVAIDLVTNAPDVLIIDYINLMASNNHTDLWKMIFDYARGFKLLAVQHDALIISLAQLDDEGRVKYSRGIKEHCDVLKIWKRDDLEDDDEEGQSFQWDVEVNVEKGRNSGTFKYWLTINTAYMRAIDKETQINHLLADARKAMNLAGSESRVSKVPPKPKPNPTPTQFAPPQIPTTVPSPPTPSTSSPPNIPTVIVANLPQPALPVKTDRVITPDFFGMENF